MENPPDYSKLKKDEGGEFLLNGQAAKRGLSRSFGDAGLGMLLDMLEYKAQWYGRTFLRVPAHHTSTDCHCCGWRNEELTLADREWTCGGCGARHDRDNNAAQNILARGIGKLKGAEAPLLYLETQTEISKPARAGAEEPIHVVSCK
jgi:transposase